jgi:thermopsin
MGVADYGVNGVSTYNYQAVTFTSWANFTKLSIGKPSPAIKCQGTTVDCMSLQQNLVDYNVFEQGSAAPISGIYWPQDVALVSQSGTKYTIIGEDNIWNFSSFTAEMGGTVNPNLLSDCSKHGGQPTFYYCTAKQQIKTTLPLEIELTTTTGVLPSGTYSGSSYVIFGIWVYHNGKLVSGQNYDEVAFKGAAASNPYFYVNGVGKNPFGSYDDAETVLCGPGGGSTVKISSIAASFTEAYIAPGMLTLTKIPHAWSAGSDTAETVSNVKMSEKAVGIGAAATGTDNNVQLW